MFLTFFHTKNLQKTFQRLALMRCIRQYALQVGLAWFPGNEVYRVVVSLLWSYIM